MNLVVLVIHHDHGTSITVHRTEAAALAELDRYVTEWWKDEDTGPIPATDTERIEQYFEYQSDCFNGESYDMEETWLEPEEVSA